MLRTITLCSGKGGVGKTLLSSSLARIIQQEQNCRILLVDLDLSVSGLTLLSFQNKIELDQVPTSLMDYLYGDAADEQQLFDSLQQGLQPDVSNTSKGPGPTALYRRLDNIYILPASSESERPEWTQFSRMELEHAIDKLSRLHAFVLDSHNIDYLIFDTQAGLGSLSLAAATLSDMNLIVLEEDDISWRTAFHVFIEISHLNKQLQHRARSYFLPNKVTPGLMDMSIKLHAFSFLPPIPYDSWMQKLIAKATAGALEKEFENSDFFRHLQTQVWKEIAQTFGLASPSSKNSGFGNWWRPQANKGKKNRPSSVHRSPPSAPVNRLRERAEGAPHTTPSAKTDQTETSPLPDASPSDQLLSADTEPAKAKQR